MTILLNKNTVVSFAITWGGWVLRFSFQFCWTPSFFLYVLKIGNPAFLLRFKTIENIYTRKYSCNWVRLSLAQWNAICGEESLINKNKEQATHVHVSSPCSFLKIFVLSFFNHWLPWVSTVVSPPYFSIYIFFHIYIISHIIYVDIYIDIVVGALLNEKV